MSHHATLPRSTRRILLACLLAVTPAFPTPATASGIPEIPAKLPVPERGFISSEPARTWEQGLICGNGTIGANALSRPLDETIVFSHERLFLPTGAPLMPPDNGVRLFEIRRLIERGLYRQAEQLAFDLSGQESFMYPDPFVPAFDLSVRMSQEGPVTDYARSVDFRTGEAVVHWSQGTTRYERRLFVSRADGVAVLALTASEPGRLSCRLQLRRRTLDKAVDARTIERSNARFESHVSDIEIGADAEHLTWQSKFSRAYPGSIQRLEGVARVIASGGSTRADGPSLIVEGADEALVLVDVGVIYDPDETRVDATKERLAAVNGDYSRLLERHARIHGEMFGRMRLDIGGSPDDHRLPTEELLEKSSREEPNRALVEKQFDAGRYNIISCVGELPPTLQGGWGGTYVPSWASDFTHNGNVPSAIASLLMGNTPELMLAYTSYIESIVPYLEINAKHMFGARGIVLPSRSTTNGFNNALAPRFAGGFWVGGAAWAAHFFYDYWLYTGDREFLAEHALPFMEKAALFFEDYLYAGPDGKWIFSPTQSPENSPANTRSQATFNSTADVAAAKELLTNLIAGSRELGVNGEKIPVWKEMLARMPEYMISEEGALKEWLTPLLEDNLRHRHSSHLYPLLDGMPEEIERSPELRAAFRKVIEIKLERHWKRGGGFMSFGVVQLGQAATSLGEAELAYECLRHLADRYWLHNLASMHNHRSLFNMDISGGMPAVIIKMLLASEPGRIRLLPAVPAAWPTGKIEGILCRGQIEARRLDWAPGRIEVTLRTERAQTIRLEAPFAIRGVDLVRGRASLDGAGSENARHVRLPADEDVTLVITR